MKTGKWDNFYSTYFWNINLDPSNPINNTPVLTGYSKKVGENEAADKIQLLKRKIVNLYLNGYFKRIRSIDFYQRTATHIDKKRDPKILVIMPTTYEIPELNREVIFKHFGNFLIEFYDRIKNEQSMDGILPRMKKIRSQDEFLDPSRYQFKTEGHLYAHAARLLNHGHPTGAVNHFIKQVKIREKWA